MSLTACFWMKGTMVQQMLLIINVVRFSQLKCFIMYKRKLLGKSVYPIAGTRQCRAQKQGNKVEHDLKVKRG